ncbi:MAG: FAD-dependent oxidoreductase [Bacteroidota bacterium]
MNEELRALANAPDDAEVRLLRRSIDARSRQIKVNINAEVYSGEQAPPLSPFTETTWPDVSTKPKAVIIGAGPAGLFAALRLIELGMKPIVLERGKKVRNRRRDIAAINKDEIVNPDSNYCFGEGGAGTYSDGKLYTRSNKRGDIRRILEIMVAHGAHPDILADAHPHIGTNKLPPLITALRETIERAGGEVHFDCKVTDFVISENRLRGAVTADGREFTGRGVILATGHSARDIFDLLHSKGILLEAKPFAMGLRAEHPQSLIDQSQYHMEDRGPWLPAASYALAEQVSFRGLEKGVFSFCMCPGGFMVPAATTAGEVVVNGMSPSRRDSKFANSGIVVSVDEEDWKAYKELGPMAGLELQKQLERAACNIAGNSQHAPAQRLADFVEGKLSDTLPETSYQPGLKSVEMQQVLPPFIHRRLQTAFRRFGEKIRGYYTNEAVLVGVESRTSSPIRIPREKETLQHPHLKGFFPCGEGAGYAGGIMSAAVDGERCAEALFNQA